MKEPILIGVPNLHRASLLLMALAAAAETSRQPEKPQGNRTERRRNGKGKRK
jgi:hypothetical protein